MNLIIVPILLGAAGILQGAFNKEIAMKTGVAHATALTNTGCFILCIAFYYLVKVYPEFFPSYFRIQTSLTHYKWWYVIPPILGFMIVAGMPLAFAELGAVKSTVYLMAMMLITSALWDFFVDHLMINLYKGLGLLFAFISIIFISLS